MTSPMNGGSSGIGELERRITRGLHDHSRLAPDSDGWEAILDRVEHRGRARHRRRAAATGLVMVGMVGTLVVLTGDDGTRVSTTPATPAAPTAGPVTATAAVGGLPRLVLDVPGFQLTHADAIEAGAPYPDLGPILVYAAPGDGLLGPGPVMFARLVPAGAPYGIGDGPEAKPVDVAGRPGRRLAYGAAQSLGWSREDGSIVHLVSMGLPDDDVLAAGQAIEEHLILRQDPPGTVAGGLELRRVTSPDASPASEAEVSYQADGRTMGLRLMAGGTYRLDDLVRDRLASSAGWRPATVDGKSAVLSTYQDGGTDPARTLMWAIEDGVVAELTAQGLSEAEMEAAAGSIRTVDEAGWDDLLNQSKVLQSVPVPGQVEADALHVSVTTEMCQARDAWLDAQDAGDAGVAEAAVADLGAVLEKGRAGGLGDTGDILVVVERLLDAMAAGDAVTVRSILAGGACS